MSMACTRSILDVSLVAIWRARSDDTGRRHGPSHAAAAALGVNLSGAEAVVVGRSNLVGKPIAQLLLGRNATVTVAHSRTRDLAATVSRADVLVAAVGRPEMISRELDQARRGSSSTSASTGSRAMAKTRPGGPTRSLLAMLPSPRRSRAPRNHPVPGGADR